MQCKGLTKHGKRCKRHSKFLYCKFHIQTHLTAVLLIQRRFRRKRLLRYVSLFKRLPDDVKRRIVFFTKEEMYVENFHASIRRIITSYINRVQSPFEFSDESNKTLMHVKYLVDKYDSILHIPLHFRFWIDFLHSYVKTREQRNLVFYHISIF